MCLLLRCSHTSVSSPRDLGGPILLLLRDLSSCSANSVPARGEIVAPAVGVLMCLPPVCSLVPTVSTVNKTRLLLCAFGSTFLFGPGMFLCAGRTLVSSRVQAQSGGHGLGERLRRQRKRREACRRRRGLAPRSFEVRYDLMSTGRNAESAAFTMGCPVLSPCGTNKIIRVCLFFCY